MSRSLFAMPVSGRIGATLLALQFFASAAHGQSVATVARSVVPNDYDAILAQEGYIRPDRNGRIKSAPTAHRLSLATCVDDGSDD
jgi:hypothetical protein